MQLKLLLVAGATSCTAGSGFFLRFLVTSTAGRAASGRLLIAGAASCAAGSRFFLRFLVTGTAGRAASGRLLVAGAAGCTAGSGFFFRLLVTGAAGRAAGGRLLVAGAAGCTTGRSSFFLFFFVEQVFQKHSVIPPYFLAQGQFINNGVTATITKNLENATLCRYNRAKAL